MALIQIEQDLADNWAAIREQRNVSWEQLATETEASDPLLAAWMRSDGATEAESRRGDTLNKAKKAEAARKRAEAADRQRAVDEAQLAADRVADTGLTTPAVAGNAVDGDPTTDAGSGEPGKTDADILGGGTGTTATTGTTDPTNAGAADKASTTSESPTQSASPASPGSTISSEDTGAAGQTSSSVAGRTSDPGLSQG